MIMVFPDGRIGGSVYSDSEWANTPSGEFESYVIDVVHDVDHRLLHARRSPGSCHRRLLGRRLRGDQHRAAPPPRLRRRREVWSGYFTQTRTGVFAHATRPRSRGQQPARLRRFVATRRSPANPLRLYMFVGRDDESAPPDRCRWCAPRAVPGPLTTYAIYAGGHDWYGVVPAPEPDADPCVRGHAPDGGAVSAHRRHHRRRGRDVHCAALRRDHGGAPGAVTPAAPGADRDRADRATRPSASHRCSAPRAALGRRDQPWLPPPASRPACATPVRALGGVGCSATARGSAARRSGWTGFLAQLVAVGARAALDRAGVRGGRACCLLPIAARALGHRLARGQLLASR